MHLFFSAEYDTFIWNLSSCTILKFILPFFKSFLFKFFFFKVPDLVPGEIKLKRALFNFILSSLVLEFNGLGYFVKYPSPPRSSTKLDKWQFIWDSSLMQPIYPAWYSRLMGSGTLWSTRAHQARVRSRINTKNWREPIKLFNLFILLGTRAWWARVLCEVPEPIKLGYEAG